MALRTEQMQSLRKLRNLPLSSEQRDSILRQPSRSFQTQTGPTNAIRQISAGTCNANPGMLLLAQTARVQASTCEFNCLSNLSRNWRPYFAQYTSERPELISHGERSKTTK